ncbi:MAG: hypothetical protein A3H50_02780 [Candidatus Levybacteria bacterium RIFCSPLOWO2_02_FULL_37_10]|nr:MAG: hypothetical protein A2860_01705 [Candidatus Levybacteria bacterium RIFCSPHIGHO2_01_FULL_37_33]OGH15772.1 MAG: hypothetical protein A3C97_01195 [Candidatus Levybacteria bacterium RIFCSPHIGHO2_02_FULL_37_11]OGH29650.1 MAG: hypothetical protein A3F30_02785 [Candidatus Levybacteria bacterium RIFCSPHIGHO2_12_FULL_37_12]OGH32577.1 MAG: hypothetical protein A2953_02300 [Candidatus Levybacteria bacterium RIFCSPLOWO2_01_FULL_36_54]OGH43193.1 MAG: hypothetical protein A3H50_02780 [Candidatus Lev
MDGGVPTEGPRPVQEIQPTKSGLEDYLGRLQTPTVEQRQLLKEFRAGNTEKTPEIDNAVETEKNERIKENLPPVVDFYRSKFQKQLDEARADLEAPGYKGSGEQFGQHRVKVLKDLLRMLDFKSFGEGVTDQEAQDVALRGLSNIMLDSYQRGRTRGGYFVGQEIKIKESGDPESQEIKDQLNRLHELEGRHDTLADDLADKSDMNWWGNITGFDIIHVNYGESTLPTSEIQASRIDPDYYRAYYGKYGTSNQWSNEYYQVLRTGTVPESVTQRIESKWERSPTQPTPQQNAA